MKDTHELYMHRCIELALLGAGRVAPNPMVGAVLVYQGRILGEGYHQQYGHPHAEVNCISHVREADHSLIAKATMYVSLEPCAHFGKTPPCTNLIIEKGIRKVVIGCRDPFEEVNGKGIEQLQKAGVDVVTGVLENECRQLNKRFFTFHLQKRPYLIVKWAQTADGKIAATDSNRLFISNQYTNRLVHQWRMAEAAVLVGTNTALMDNPSLDNRLWTGPSPVRMVIDGSLRLPANLKLFNQQQRTIVFNFSKQDEDGAVLYYRLPANTNVLSGILDACYSLSILSVLIEGGARLIQSFIDAGLWDEARVIVNKDLTTGNGLQAPVLEHGDFIRAEKILSDTVWYYEKNSKFKSKN